MYTQGLEILFNSLTHLFYNTRLKAALGIYCLALALITIYKLLGGKKYVS